ncbi:MAG: hypothetical protein KKF27_20620 [Gammaproteobacteria bacterium]|nr:hypothetical protein [Gammaproteobacteria bacterium]
MKKNLRSDLRMWVKHWYLGGGSDENRVILTPGARAEEKIAYKMIWELLGNDAVIDPNASPLSVSRTIQEWNGGRKHRQTLVKRLR